MVDRTSLCEVLVLHMHLHDCVNGSPHSALGTGDVAISKKINQLEGENCLIEVK